MMWKINRILFAVVAMMAVSTTLAATDCGNGVGTICKSMDGSCAAWMEVVPIVLNGGTYCTTGGDSSINLSGDVPKVCGTSIDEVAECGDEAPPADPPTSSAFTTGGMNRILLLAMMLVTMSLAATDCGDGSGGKVCKATGATCPESYSKASQNDADLYCVDDPNASTDFVGGTITVCGTNVDDVDSCDDAAEATPTDAPAPPAGSPTDSMTETDCGDGSGTVCKTTGASCPDGSNPGQTLGGTSYCTTSADNSATIGGDDDVAEVCGTNIDVIASCDGEAAAPTAGSPTDPPTAGATTLTGSLLSVAALLGVGAMM